jgi:hypothetical protein
LFNKTQIVSTMINQRNSRSSFATLILCLCLGSLVVLPFIQTSPSMPELFGVDAGNYNLFDQAEFDFDLFVISIVGVAIAELYYSKPRPMNLDFESTSLLPVSPPPKPS